MCAFIPILFDGAGEPVGIQPDSVCTIAGPIGHEVPSQSGEKRGKPPEETDACPHVHADQTSMRVDDPAPAVARADGGIVADDPEPGIVRRSAAAGFSHGEYPAR